jgi:hypothetical protein
LPDSISKKRKPSQKKKGALNVQALNSNTSTKKKVTPSNASIATDRTRPTGKGVAA